MVIYKGKSEKLTWKQIREDVAKVNPEFAAAIDKIDPGEEYWVLKTSYPYGSNVLKSALLHLPNSNGDVVPITDASIDTEIREGIGYNMNSNPVSLVLKNSFEIFLPLENRAIPFCDTIKSGAVFGAWRLLSSEKTEHPVFTWDMTAGARSVFMLPKITEDLKHKKLEKNFGIDAPIPKHFMQHFDVFRQLVNCKQSQADPWEAEILYFSKAWFSHIDDDAWASFYQYFYRKGWGSAEYWRNKPFWDLIFSLVLEKYEAKPNAYIMDTVKYLLYMGIGALPGFGPVTDTIAGPFDVIQDIYRDVYDIRNYPPIIMQPKVFDMKGQQPNPVYYSLQFPNALEFKLSTRARASIVSDLHEIRSLVKRYARDLSSDKFNITGTSFHNLFDLAEYGYFHSGVDLHEGMQDSVNIAEDKNIRTTLDGKIHDEFPASSLFFKGCIQVNKR